MCPTSGTSMPMGLCSSTPSRHQPSTASSTTTTTSAPRRTRLAKSGAQTSVLKQFSGSRTPSGWRTKGRCVETWLFSSASSPLQCRNTLVLCPGRKTPFLSSQPAPSPWSGAGFMVPLLPSTDPLLTVSG
uniref:Uncharacterized protein n=1 Tax=Anas platyrhynchos platyrhynchos TaxID=8840 RepID=A0A493TPJ9_ANAPP